MKVLIVEDERLAANKLRSLIKECAPKWEIVGICASVEESIEALTHSSIDLLFLDIQLSDGIGFEIFERITVTIPVIFTTAFEEYALKAFDHYSIDYLVKPITKAKLKESIAKVNRVQHWVPDNLLLAMREFGYQTTNYRMRFLIQLGERFVPIQEDEIAYFYALEKLVHLVTQSGKHYIIDETLDQLESEIDPKLFFRINRKFLVRITSIQKMEAWTRSRILLTLHPPQPKNLETIVSIEKAKGFKAWLNK